MCHDANSRPPGVGTPGEVAARERTVLTAPDGNRFAAFAARPATSNGAGMVILPDVRGLHPFYIALADRFAEAGIDAVALDYFGRTAGVGERDDAFDWQPHVQQTSPAGIAADASAAIGHLKTNPAVRAAFTVGFCFGGSNSWRLSASDLDLAGVIGFYGRPGLVRDVVDRMRHPLLLLVAGNDQATPLSESEDFDKELAAAGVDHEMHVYDGAPHSFFDRAYADWQEACADAWQRILAFTGRLTPPA